MVARQELSQITFLTPFLSLFSLYLRSHGHPTVSNVTLDQYTPFGLMALQVVLDLHKIRNTSV